MYKINDVQLAHSELQLDDAQGKPAARLTFEKIVENPKVHHLVSSKPGIIHCFPHTSNITI